MTTAGPDRATLAAARVEAAERDLAAAVERWAAAERDVTLATLALRSRFQTWDAAEAEMGAARTRLAEALIVLRGLEAMAADGPK